MYVMLELAKNYPISARYPSFGELVLNSVEHFSKRDIVMGVHREEMKLTFEMLAAAYRHSYTNYNEAVKSFNHMAHTCMVSDVECNQMVCTLRERCRRHLIKYLRGYFRDNYGVYFADDTFAEAVCRIRRGHQDTEQLLEGFRPKPQKPDGRAVVLIQDGKEVVMPLTMVARETGCTRAELSRVICSIFNGREDTLFGIDRQIYPTCKEADMRLACSIEKRGPSISLSKDDVRQQGYAHKKSAA